MLANYDVVVITDSYNKQDLIRINEFCRSHKKGFIYSGLLGLYGFGFVDFGDHHTVVDPNGEEPRNAIVVGVS